MMRSLVFTASVLSLALGCATTARTTAHTKAAHPAEPAAKRLYNVGETRFAAGHPEEAVTLWRHAITQLPATEAYDGLRHKLILRLAFGQLVAFHEAGKLAHLFDAKRMLERYLVTHEALFGESVAAKAERGQVYEILFEIERRIEDPPEYLAASSAVALVEPHALPIDPSTTEAAPTPAKKNRRSRAREDAEGNERVVIVDTRGRPSVDDPAFRRTLRQWDPNAGLVLTRPSIVPWLPARAYVRIDGLARRLDDGASVGRGTQAVAADVIRSIRPALRACYDGAFARAPADYSLATVEFAVTAQGTVEAPHIIDGMVGDALGDACVLERLAGAQLERPDAEPMQLAVNLMFFYDDAVMFNEGTSRSVRNELDLAVDSLAASTALRRKGRNTDVPRGMGPITR